MVAAANFASTYCQYDALRFVGFTTQALAKCAKMVPVLLIGSLFYKKSYKTKEYVCLDSHRLLAGELIY
jgi:adenosine 3'-phospho 5'-phosphosulfate transporter B2